jgi:hypothetical protein
MGELVIAFLHGETIADWWPVTPAVSGAEVAVPSARVVGPSVVGTPSEPFPPTEIAGIPSGQRPLTTPAGALVGVPVEPVLARVRAASTHADLAAAMETPPPRALDLDFGDFILLGLSLMMMFSFWVYGAYMDHQGTKTWSQIPTPALWIGGVMSVIGVGLLWVFVSRIRRQLRAPVARAVVGVIDSRRTESRESEITRAALVFEDGRVRDYRLRRSASKAAAVGAVGVACFREDDVIAFVSLS